ncbi:MAG: Ig-like domain-containing protein, partial [Candidatus Latescibacterota bacterium]
DGTADAGYLTPSGVNFLSQSWGQTDFIPEYWDFAEGPFDDPEAKSELLVGATWVTADIQTNVDIEPPDVTNISPDSNSVDVLVNTAVVIGFSEEIDYNTVSGNFRLENKGTGVAVGGTGTVYDNGLILSFAPWGNLEYGTTYRCSLATGIKDKWGNGLSAPVAFDFATEAEPALHTDALVPDRGVAGSVVVITGGGFDVNPANNVVEFTDQSGSGTVSTIPVSASPTQLVVNVHPDAGTGPVVVTVGVNTSVPLNFTVLPPVDVSRGFEAGSAVLGATPRSLAVLPNGAEAYVTTDAGVSIVDVDPGSPGFMNDVQIPVANGLREIDASPDGKFVFATNDADSMVYVIDALTQTFDDTFHINARPQGVVLGPVGDKAYIPTDAGEIQVWDLQTGSPTYREPINAISSPDANMRGGMAVDPTGSYLLVPSGAGKVLAFHVGPDTFLVD